MTEEIFLSSSTDAEMEEASANARKSFQIFWRELSWEMRRIIPGLDMSIVKRGFPTNKEGSPSLEHMWVGDITFDGNIFTGSLLNQPNYIDNLDRGDTVQFHFESLAGNLTQVELLLKYGADKNVKNVHGQTAQDLARMFNWVKILAVVK